MLDITNDNLLQAGSDWYDWQYMPLFWKNWAFYVSLKSNMQEMC